MTLLPNYDYSKMTTAIITTQKLLLSKMTMVMTTVKNDYRNNDHENIDYSVNYDYRLIMTTYLHVQDKED
jgi:hypothetical protein